MPPVLVLVFILASIYGLVFFVMFGQGWMRLGLYWLVGVVGFGLGQWLGSLTGITLLNIGPINFVEGTLFSWISLFAFRAWRH